MYDFNGMSESAWDYCRERWESRLYDAYYGTEVECEEDYSEDNDEDYDED